MSGSSSGKTNMFWLTLIVGMQVLGFGITLGRLAYDEWQQCRLSSDAQKAGWESPDPKKADVMSADLDEKRAIPAARAPGEHAVEAEPAQRHLSHRPAPVTFSSIMDARPQWDSVSNVTNDGEPPPLPLPAGMCDRNLSREAA